MGAASSQSSLELSQIATSSSSTFVEEGLTTAQKKLGTDKIEKVLDNYVEVQYFNFEKKCSKIQNLSQISNAVFDSDILRHSIGKIVTANFAERTVSVYINLHSLRVLPNIYFLFVSRVIMVPIFTPLQDNLSHHLIIKYII